MSATDDEIAELKAALIRNGSNISSSTALMIFCTPKRLRALLDRLEAAERQVKGLREELTFVGDMATYALKTDDDGTSAILATIRDTSRAALEAKSHDG